MRTKLILSAALSLSLCAASTAQTLPAYLPTDGLVGWWPFNGNANDESGNGNDGIFLQFNGQGFEINPNPNSCLGEDRLGDNLSALSINTYASNVAVPINNILFQSDFSISIWAKNDSIVFQYPTIVNSDNFNFIIQYGNTGGPITVGSYLAGLNVQPFGGVGSLINYLDWTLITVVNENYINKLYINGNLASTATDSSILQGQSNGSYIRFGNGIQLPQETFYGSIDDIAIYNRALSPEEITALYTGEPVNPPNTCNPLPSNLQNGLVGYWPFCGNANDESGNGNDGTVNGATLTEDRFGVANAAYDFDGLNDYTEILNSALLEFNEGITFAAWIKPTNYQLGGVIDKSGGSVGGFRICTRPLDNVADWNDRKLWVESTQYASGYGSAISENNYLLNEWQFVVGTFNPITNNCSLYLNGLLEDTSVNNAGNVNNLSSNIKFGLSPTVTPEFFSGAIDDIGIWNRALSPEEVQQLYTLNACTFTVYDTVTVENVVTVYDTVLTTVTDTLIINTLITALAPPANTNTIKVFPNPAGSILTIDYGNYALMNGYQLRIENSLGQEVFQTNISQQSDTLSLGTWGGNGLYFVHIVDPQGNTIDIRKIVLQ